MKKQLLSQARLSQFLCCLALFLLCSNLSWGQTTVFHETFGSTAITWSAPTPVFHTGGTSTVPASPSQAVYTRITNPAATSATAANVALNSTDGYLYMPQTASGNGKIFQSTPIPTGLNPILTNNTGDITWTFNVRTSNNSVTASTFNDNGRFFGVILGANSTNAFTSGSTQSGYAVVINKSTTDANYNAIKLVKMENGFVSGTTGVTTLLESPAVTANNNFYSVKVVYDPNNDNFKMYYRNDGASAWTNAATDSGYTQVGAEAGITETTFVSTTMVTQGVFSGNSATGSGFFFDNMKIVVSPPPTAPIISNSPAFTTFTYEGTGPSTIQTSVIDGDNLTGDITLEINTATDKYQFSLNNFSTIATTGTLVIPDLGSLSVRLKAGLAAGPQNQTIELKSNADLYTKNINLSGTVIGAYTYNGSGSLSDVNNWTPVPSAMTEAAAKFYITTNAATDFVWALGASSIASVKDGATLTIADTFPITGQVNVLAASTLIIDNSTYPTLGTIDATSNVHLRKQPITTHTGSISFGNLFIDGGNTITFSGGSSILSGTYTINGTLTVAEDSNISFNSSSPYSSLYFATGAKAVINGNLKQSRAFNLVEFSKASLQTVNNNPPLQFFDAEAVGVNFILGPNSTIEYSRGNSSTPQLVTPRSDYKNLAFSDGSNGANTKTVDGTINVSGTLTLNHLAGASTFAGSGNFTLGNGATIVRTSGSFGTAVPINFGSSVNVTYDGTTAITTGEEIPSNPSTLNNLIINNAAGVTLSEPIIVNNATKILSGKLNLGTFAHSTNKLNRGILDSAAGSWGSTASAATNKDDDHFDVAGTGILNLITSTLSTKDFESGTFTYYPNPVEDILTLNYANTIDTVEVFNILGQKVYASQPNATSTQLDLSNLKSAIYIVKISSNGKAVAARIYKK
ncbi:T9SS type A sorting domain-containing protein [Flavobacterium sp. NG2]|uniref:beta strand repeat-containing protein n=1 Tax=Flavobacterium sp. NG2 TaxID=3097547 RepID=UPI002A840CE2|nr:T9SS type A sorting domain-containing protein [Flavobacterium sp. NG2]WPR71565.1 T9SS type A sorting domain-containing protein [Flavobacterium sp. NG2]